MEDLEDHLDSILFVPYIDWKDGWFVSYMNLTKSIRILLVNNFIFLH